jgi:hypothetical protein
MHRQWCAGIMTMLWSQWLSTKTSLSPSTSTEMLCGAFRQLSRTPNCWWARKGMVSPDRDLCNLGSSLHCPEILESALLACPSCPVWFWELSLQMMIVKLALRSHRAFRMHWYGNCWPRIERMPAIAEFKCLNYVESRSGVNCRNRRSLREFRVMGLNLCLAAVAVMFAKLARPSGCG